MYQQPRRMVYKQSCKEDVAEVKETKMATDEDIYSEYLTRLFVLKTKTKERHFVTKGTNFLSVHEMYDDIYEFLCEAIDEIAENLTGNEIPFTIEIGRIKTIDNVLERGEDWDTLIRDELEDFLAAKEYLYKSKEKSEDDCLLGLGNILDGQAQKLEMYIYFLKQFLA